MVSRICKVARGRCPHLKTVPGERSSATCHSGLPPPLTAPLLLPLPCAAAGPPPPPRLRCAMGGGRQAELRGAKLSGRRHLIPSRRGEGSDGHSCTGPRRPQTRTRFQDKGWEVAATTHQRGRRQSPRARMYCSGRPGAGGAGETGQGWGMRGGRESGVGAQSLDSMRRGSILPRGAGDDTARGGIWPIPYGDQIPVTDPWGRLG